MIKLMLADIDIENVNSFRTFIRKNFPIFQLVKPALISREFYKNIEMNLPDVIVIEMKFFGTATFQNIKEFRFSHPNVKIVLYGSITDSEYMKKALDFGVTAYMYRPVKPSELGRCLNEVLESLEKEKKLDEEQHQLMNVYQDSMFFFESKFFSTLIHGHLKSEFEIENSLDYFDIHIQQPYTVALIRIDHFKSFVLALDEKEKHLVVLRILKLANSLIPNGKAYIITFNEIGIIVGDSQDYDEVVKILNNIKNEIMVKLKIGVSIGIGRTYENLTQIRVSYNEAEAALRYRCNVGYNSVISIDFVEPKNRITCSYPIEREELLVYTAVIGEYDYCVKLLDELFESLESAGELPENLISQLVMDVLISINRNAVEQDLNIKNLFKCFPTASILRLKTIEEAREYMKKGLKEFCEGINVLRKEMEDALFQRAITYIDEHYFESLTSGKIAQILNCSVAYFNRLFFERMEKSLNDYIMRKRIDEAKRLIIETELDDEMIAIKIGFEDLNVFKNYFKQFEGYMVADFRFIKNKNKKIR